MALGEFTANTKFASIDAEKKEENGSVMASEGNTAGTPCSVVLSADETNSSTSTSPSIFKITTSEIQKSDELADSPTFTQNNFTVSSASSVSTSMSTITITTTKPPTTTEPSKKGVYFATVGPSEE